MHILPLSQAVTLPVWRRPIALLFVLSVAMAFGFATWSALLNNFVIEVADFDGADIGWLHTVREVPGFLAVGVIALLMLFHEQTLGIVALILFGAAVAVTAWFPSMTGILTLTLLSSIGFHYFETVNASLQLQWIPKATAPRTLGWLVAASSAATLVAYLAIVLTWRTFDLSYAFVYMTAGGATLLLALFCLLAYPRFKAPHPQRTRFVLRRRYWLYYALQFMSGARRQIFVVFAGFMMVERFGFDVHALTWLFLATLIFNIAGAPLIGRLVQSWGERNALALEYIGLTLVFLAYGGLYWFGWGVMVAAALYIIDHIFFALFLALQTYFQKIADPADFAPTAAVSFTINHIAAVFLPALLGYLWLASPGAVFAMAASMAVISLGLALLIPRHPEPGCETILCRKSKAPAPA